MAAALKSLCAALALMALVLAAAAAAPPASGSCGSTLSSLRPCLPAVEGDDPPLPTDECCAVVRATDTPCLCSVVVSYSNAMGVNMDGALRLPKECKHAVPAGYTCGGYPVPSYIPANRKLMSL